MEERVNRTLMQLEKAKRAVERLDDVAVELQRSRARVQTLEELVYALRLEAGRTEAELRKSRYEVESLRTSYEDLSDENERNRKSNAIRIGLLREEADRSERKAERAMEQLEAAERASIETEGELRRLKVRSDQWRKAAEVAAGMVSSGWNIDGGRSVGRTCSMERGYGSPFSDDEDEGFVKRRNGYVMSLFGVLWKKQHK